MRAPRHADAPNTSLIVGGVLVLRDYAQRRWAHWCLGWMALAAVLSYVLGSPAVALASATAFAVSETIDWAVYTVTRRLFADRVLLSTACSAPVDTAVFLYMARLPSLLLFGLGVSAKLVAGVVIWAILRRRAAEPDGGTDAARGRARRETSG